MKSVLKTARKSLILPPVEFRNLSSDYPPPRIFTPKISNPTPLELFRNLSDDYPLEALLP